MSDIDALYAPDQAERMADIVRSAVRTAIAEAQPCWIRVDEWEPDLCEWVRWRHSNGSTLTGAVVVWDGRFKYVTDKRIDNEATAQANHLSNYSHWMPLELPKETP